MKRFLSPVLLATAALWGCGPEGDDFATAQQPLGQAAAGVSSPGGIHSTDSTTSAQSVDSLLLKLLGGMPASPPPKDGSPVSAPQDPIPAVPGGDPRASNSLGPVPAGGAHSSDGSGGK